MVTTAHQFAAVKQHLDGLVFWRELPNNHIEIKFIPCYLKYINPKVLTLLKPR